MKLLAICIFVLGLVTVVSALDCSSDSDCPTGFSCQGSECMGTSSCNSFCANDVAYQTAKSSKGCWIFSTYPCTYGCSETGPDCATQKPSPKKVQYCTKKDYSSVYECTITPPAGASATILSCIDDCKRTNSIPMAIAQAGGMVDVLIEEDFRNCVTDYCLKAAPTDKCAGVSCENKCENNVFYSSGTCESGQCSYTETNCPQGCTSQGCTGSVAGEIFLYDEKGKKVPIRFATMELIAVKDTHILYYGHISTDGNGRFEWNEPRVFTEAKVVSGTLYLNDTNARLYVSSDFGSPIGISIMNDVPITDPTLSALEIDLTQLKNKNLTADARIYATGSRAVDFKEKVLKLNPTVRERIVSFSSDGNHHLGEFYPDSSSNPTGMSLLENTSKFGNQYIDDTIFHEYCHHIQDESQGKAHTIPGQDHMGYPRNPTSEWGLIEGWAEFCALEMKREYKTERYALYRIRGEMIDLEPDYRMDQAVWREKQSWHPVMIEEMAIASLLVDLRDSPSDYGNIDDDHVTLPISTIWDAFHKKRDFNDGKGVRDAYTLRDFYLALKEETKGDVSLNSPYLRGSNLTNLDYVFVKHGAFQDIDNNSRWDDGEPIGYSGRNATLREDLEPIEGTEVDVQVLDQDGAVEGMSVHVRVDFDGDYRYLSYQYDVPLDEGSLNVPLPPQEYNATITMTAFQTGTSNKAENSFTITTQEAYAKLDPDAKLGTYTAVVKTGPVPCDSDYQCVYAGWAGCVEGSCSSSTGNGLVPEPEPCCGSAFLVLGVLSLACLRR
jgi:hypothetical protein